MKKISLLLALLLGCLTTAFSQSAANGNVDLAKIRFRQKLKFRNILLITPNMTITVKKIFCLLLQDV